MPQRARERRRGIAHLKSLVAESSYHRSRLVCGFASALRAKKLFYSHGRNDKSYRMTLLDPLFRWDAVDQHFSDRARLQAMLDFEAALARW